MSSIKPVGNKLIVLPLEKKEEKLGSIVIAESVNAELSEGEVVEVSADISHLYEKGNIVLYPSKVGVGIIYNNAPHLWVTSDQVWGIKTETKVKTTETY